MTGDNPWIYNGGEFRAYAPNDGHSHALPIEPIIILTTESSEKMNVLRDALKAKIAWGRFLVVSKFGSGIPTGKGRPSLI